MWKWISNHKVPLLVALIMFAFMAMFMGEMLFLEDPKGYRLWETLVTPDEFTSLHLWVWRIGGLVTWPVFMYLMLRPHATTIAPVPNSTATVIAPQSKSVLIGSCAIAAAYGAFGLWIVSSAMTHMIDLMNKANEFLVLTPILALLLLVLPFAYVWGFVALYGFSRCKLAGKKDKSWIGPSIIGSILGILGVGVLVGVALVIIMIPIMLVFSSVSSSSVAGQHLSVDLVAMAISSGNFISQWLGFKRVDEKLSPELYGPKPPVQRFPANMPPAMMMPPQVYGQVPMQYPYAPQSPQQTPQGWAQSQPSQQTAPWVQPQPQAAAQAVPWAQPQASPNASAQPPASPWATTPSPFAPYYTPQPQTPAASPVASPSTGTATLPADPDSTATVKNEAKMLPDERIMLPDGTIYDLAKED